MSVTGKVCVRCQRELRCKENQVGALLMDGNAPDVLHDADLWECPGCGFEVVLGFGRAPMAYGAERDFEKILGEYQTVVRYHR